MRKHNYVIGYEGDGQCIYGKLKDHRYEYCDPMTLLQAKRMQKKTYSYGKNRKIKTVIYKLVKINETT